LNFYFGDIFRLRYCDDVTKNTS